jgi:hypothetical protein
MSQRLDDDLYGLALASLTRLGVAGARAGFWRTRLF